MPLTKSPPSLYGISFPYSMSYMFLFDFNMLSSVFLILVNVLSFASKYPLNVYITSYTFSISIDKTNSVLSISTNVFFINSLVYTFL